MSSFAYGLKQMFEREVFVKRCRMTPKKKAVILEMLDYTSDMTYKMENFEFEKFMFAKRWLNYQLGITNEKQKIDVKTAGYIKIWLNDFNYYPFEKKDFEGACEWIMNKLSKKYSLAEMSIGEEFIKK